MTNHQFDEVEELIHNSSTRPNECPTCGATATEVADGITDWESSSYRYEEKDHPCDCAEQEMLFRHYLLARIPQEFMNLDLGEWVGDQDAVDATVSYLEKWDNLRRHGMGLGYYGPQGTGKTFLAMWLARKLVKKGESVYCISFRSMIDIFELSHEDRVEEEKRLRGCTVLVLDEVTRGVSDKQHALFAEKFETLIRHRSNYNKVTILTTNLSPEKLDDLYPRTYSLLAAKEQSIQVNGSDQRRETIYDVNKELALNGEARPIT